MMTSLNPSITVIGTGALGSTLENFFRESKYKIQSTWNSRGGSVYSEESGKYQLISSNLPLNDSETGELVFITTPDDLISKTAKSLSDNSIIWKEKTVVHCSGNLMSDELSALSNKGANIVSMHPIQTFNRGDGSDRFKDITISLQGDLKAKEQLKPIIEEMGANCILLDKKQKRYLHIAAVMASNYLVALMFSVENLLKDAQLDKGFESLELLVHQTITNIFESGPSKALTGPISRGDIESVQTHLKELKGREQEKIFKILGLEAVKIAEESGGLSQNQIDDLKNLLSIS